MDEKEELAALRVQLSAYRKIIERYSEAINAGEQKTIPDLKMMVSASDEAVVAAKTRILNELALSEVESGQAPHYRYEKEFLSAAEKAYSFVQAFKKIHHDMPVNVWLKPREMVEIGAADAFDKAIFLCSLLLALGCRNAKIRVLELEGGLKHPVVVFAYNEKQYLMDPSQECSAFTYHGTLEQILKEYTFEAKKAAKWLYEFNNEEYVELD